MNENKSDFVKNYLAPLLKAACATISEVEYIEGKSVEIVRVEMKNGFVSHTCVSGDSLLAMTSDVTRTVML